jgi:hypothetical protein
LRDEALDWVTEQEKKQKRLNQMMFVATIMTAVAAWTAALALLSGGF